MTYAIISDIHGNADALSAVLKDAENANVDHYIFVGDYASHLPYPNEVIHQIKALENKTVIQGNEDACFGSYAGQDQSAWTDGQFQAHYWCYRQLTRTHLDYLCALPKAATIKDGRINIAITHKSTDVFGDIEHMAIPDRNITEKSY